MKTLPILSVSVVLIFFAQAAAGVPNGDFESGNTGFLTEYIFSPGDIVPAQSYDVLSDPSDAHFEAASFGDHTSGTGLMLAANGATESAIEVWSHTTAVAPGVQYTFSMWLASWDPTPPYNPAQLEISINGAVVDVANAPSTVGTWEQYTTVWNSGISTTAAIEIVNLETAATGNDFAIDDITFTPEPATLGLLAIGGEAMMKRKRK